MHKAILTVLATTSALTALPAWAQTVEPATQTSGQKPAPPADSTGALAGNQGGVDDIIVTARREAENLQNVPVSVQVVTGDSLKKLSINDVSEVSKLAPGLTLTGDSGGGGQNNKVVLRGVTWQPGSGTPATPIYYNEAPFDPSSTLTTLFDIGQIEVLRGPQGTSRGAPSISGAVTITTHKPDLDEFGGYVQLQYGEGDHKVAQGAINIPVIQGVLALRAAANIEDSNGNRVDSVNGGRDPSFKSRVYRISALLQPTDTLSIGGMYQRRRQVSRLYNQVDGPGSPGIASLGVAANFNGPAIRGRDYESPQDAPSTNRLNTDLITANVNWEVAGQRLTFNYGRQIPGQATSFQTIDPGNLLPGFEAYNTLRNSTKQFFQTLEVRLSSQPDDTRPFDYDIGWFSKHSDGEITYGSPYFLAGAFGAPGARPGSITTPDQRYTLQSTSQIYLAQSFDSFYGNIRFHLTDSTELSGGLSILRDRDTTRLNVQTSGARTIATPLSALGGLPCAGIPGVFVTGLVNSVYTGFCDAVLPAGFGAPAPYARTDEYSDALYNFSLSHKFNDDVLAYATTGTSFRTGLPAINNPGLPNNLLVPDPEKATSYEVGLKTSFSRRLRVNAAIFQINYDNQLTTFGGIPYFNSTNGTPSITSVAFYRNVDARVRGAEVEIAAKPINQLSLNLNLSYSKITSRGGLVPCVGTAALTAANPINLCQSEKGETLNTQSPFQATASGSYDLPITSNIAGYFRFNVNFQGRNPNYGNFPINGRFTRTRAFALTDLFAGVSGNEGAWDLGVYAKNVFNNRRELSRVAQLNSVYALFPSDVDGYDAVAYTAPREVGVTLRYSFGSR